MCALGAVSTTLTPSISCCRTELTTESPLWVGAWWVGFLGAGAAAFLIAIPILGYPRQLPGGCFLPQVSGRQDALCPAPPPPLIPWVMPPSCRCSLYACHLYPLRAPRERLVSIGRCAPFNSFPLEKESPQTLSHPLSLPVCHHSASSVCPEALSTSWSHTQERHWGLWSLSFTNTHPFRLPALCGHESI